MATWENVKQLDQRQQVRRSKKTKTKSEKGKLKASEKKFLLPQVIGLRWISDREFELITQGGLVDIQGEFWSTEKLTDELSYCMAKKEAEPELVIILNNDCDYTCYQQEQIDLLERYESCNTLLYRKYIIRAEKLVGEYRKDRPNIFLINLVDLTERIKAELLDLLTANSRATLSRVLHSAVARIFAQASLSWFYDSARDEIEVILQP